MRVCVVNWPACSPELWLNGHVWCIMKLNPTKLYNCSPQFPNTVLIKQQNDLLQQDGKHDHELLTSNLRTFSKTIFFFRFNFMIVNIFWEFPKCLEIELCRLLLVNVMTVESFGHITVGLEYSKHCSPTFFIERNALQCCTSLILNLVNNQQP